MKNLGKRKVRSHTKVRALFAENKMHFACAKQPWLFLRVTTLTLLSLHNE